MAEVSIVDIGGVQWNIKDKESRDKIAVLEEKTYANFEYSMEEKEIGTWIDGKPLYRCIIQGNTTSKASSVNLASKNIASITKMDGTFMASSLYILPITNYLARNTTELGQIYSYSIYNILTKNLEISFGQKDYYSNVNFVMQLEYTKNE